MASAILGRLRCHRDRARAGDEHADGESSGHRRPAVAADGSPPRSGPPHRRRRPSVGARAQRHAGISPCGESRCAGAAHRRLARHRRHRRHRCRPASSPSRAAPNVSPRLPARWSRCRRSKPMAAALWPQAMSVAVSIPDATQGRADRAPDHAEGCRTPRRCSARPRPSARPNWRCRRISAWSTTCRCWAPARPTMSGATKLGQGACDAGRADAGAGTSLSRKSHDVVASPRDR